MGFLPVIFALCQTQLAVHDELCGGFQIRVAAAQSLGILCRELAQHPRGKVVVRVGLGTHADADAGEVLPAQAGDDALQAVMSPAEPEGRMRSLPGFWVISSHRTMTWSAGILKKPAVGAMESPERFM